MSRVVMGVVPSLHARLKEESEGNLSSRFRLPIELGCVSKVH
jgi:hypothetical protein